jgi:hypothetical protein
VLQANESAGFVEVQNESATVIPSLRLHVTVRNCIPPQQVRLQFPYGTVTQEYVFVWGGGRESIGTPPQTNSVPTLYRLSPSFVTQAQTGSGKFTQFHASPIQESQTSIL